MKNRKRESCTSGTVRDEDGNILIYSEKGQHPVEPPCTEFVVEILLQCAGIHQLFRTCKIMWKLERNML